MGPGIIKTLSLGSESDWKDDFFLNQVTEFEKENNRLKARLDSGKDDDEEEGADEDDGGLTEEEGEAE